MNSKKINPNIANKTVLLLADFFLPMRKILPTIENLVKNKNKVIVASFFGQASLAPLADRLAETLERKFIDLPSDAPRLPEYDIPHLYFARNIGLLSGMRGGDIAIVENLNLLPKEMTSELTAMSEIFVNDDFSADSDRLRLLKKNLPSGHGLAFDRTDRNLVQFLSRSKKPQVLVLGGMTLAGKELLLDKLMARADTILVAGGVANLFFKLMDYQIGESDVDRNADEKALKKLMRDYKSKIKLPVDVVVAAKKSGSASRKKPEKVGPGEMISDIGPQTTLEFSKYLKQGRTLIWCGALGRVEETSFRHGTGALLRLFASRPSLPGVVAAASGETVFNLLEEYGFLESLDLTMPETPALLRALTK